VKQQPPVAVLPDARDLRDVDEVRAVDPDKPPGFEPLLEFSQRQQEQVPFARRVDDHIRDFVMKGYETARQIIERQRVAVEALAKELLDVESVDADRLKQILAAAMVPALPVAVREAITEAARN
jgi:ATP-dependent Zn protease